MSSAILDRLSPPTMERISCQQDIPPYEDEPIRSEYHSLRVLKELDWFPPNQSIPDSRQRGQRGRLGSSRGPHRKNCWRECPSKGEPVSLSPVPLTMMTGL